MQQIIIRPGHMKYPDHPRQMRNCATKRINLTPIVSCDSWVCVGQASRSVCSLRTLISLNAQMRLIGTEAWAPAVRTARTGWGINGPETSWGPGCLRVQYCYGHSLLTPTGTCTS